MILSHSHKFIFFAVPRTGTHSTREALRPHLGKGDWEQQVLNGRHLAPISAIAEIGHGHISVQEIRSVIPENIWATYYKFAVVRNPFDRFVSVCSFLNRDNPEYKAQPTIWMKAALTRTRFLGRVLVRPQYHQLCDFNNEVRLDFIGRYEDLQASIDRIFADLALPAVSLIQRNASSHAHYQQYYDEELKEAVADHYREDLMQFNYEFQEI